MERSHWTFGQEFWSWTSLCVLKVKTDTERRRSVLSADPLWRGWSQDGWDLCSSTNSSNAPQRLSYKQKSIEPNHFLQQAATLLSLEVTMVKSYQKTTSTRLCDHFMDIRRRVFLPFLVSSHLWAYEEVEDQHYPRRSWLASFGDKLQVSWILMVDSLKNYLMRWAGNTGRNTLLPAPGCLRGRI